MLMEVGYDNLLGINANRNAQYVHPFVWFLTSPQRIVRFSVEDPEFKEEVLEYENVEDFLVDDKLTITFLTSAGLLRQVRPTDTIPPVANTNGLTYSLNRGFGVWGLGFGVWGLGFG